MLQKKVSQEEIRLGKKNQESRFWAKYLLDIQLNLWMWGTDEWFTGDTKVSNTHMWTSFTMLANRGDWGRVAKCIGREGEKYVTTKRGTVMFMEIMGSKM